MKSPKWKSCSEVELWKFVAFHFAKAGIETILVGGSVVSIYSEGIYKSGDIDMVLNTYSRMNDAEEIMKSIGFQKFSTRYFKHPKCDHLFVEFLHPPVMIGDDAKNIKLEKVEVEKYSIKILSPTDCIKDRLASFIYFKSRECLDQALLVARKQKFNMKDVESWSKQEGNPLAMKGFKEFKEAFLTSSV